MTPANLIAVGLGLVVAWLLGYYFGHRETVRRYKQHLLDLFQPPRRGTK
jgi:multisubunit Na+/H+ antiporter MnhB subunit